MRSLGPRLGLGLGLGLDEGCFGFCGCCGYWNCFLQAWDSEWIDGLMDWWIDGLMD